LYGVKGEKKRQFSAALRDVWKVKRLSNNRNNKWHPAEKPVRLIKQMILNSSKEGDLVLDTFTGSGNYGCCLYGDWAAIRWL